jgi:hypothetical protein
VFENGYLFLFPDFVKIVHVELPHKGRKLLVFEVFRQYLILKEILILHNKTIAVVCPFNNVAIFLIL